MFDVLDGQINVSYVNSTDHIVGKINTIYKQIIGPTERFI